ncbi:MAG: RICIN domain-containing protein [Oscillospiraceae bacterium]|nr:RICIN domain-containing protein [Oscillospiraceae bacterium]
MKQSLRKTLAAAMTLPTALAGLSLHAANTLPVSAAITGSTGTQTVEFLDRGISAVNTGSGMLVSWRWLASDSDTAVFNLYRDNTLIYTSESGQSTCYLDKGGSASSKYRVDYVSGSRVITSDSCSLISNGNYFDIKLSQPGSGYTPNDCSVGDVDGDGQYEIFLKWDPSNSKDNSQSGKTDPVYIDCYKLNGTRLWRINLGVNIRAGAHYTQFYVADFDLDGKAEMTCKTADGTTDGTGKVIGDASKDYRNSSGFIITGPEYYTLFDGLTGAALDTVNYEPGRGTTTAWGKSSDKTNRVDRFWGTVAYLDGVHPSVVTGRGYYGRMTATAYSVENKKLKKLWMFDSGTSSSSPGYGDGNHNSMAADVDGDGKQEVCNGPSIIDDNGTMFYCTNQGHGDALHLGDLDPSNPGLELWICHEESVSGYGVSLIDCDQKKILYHQNGAGDTGRCCADNVWAGNPGAECWGNKVSDGSTPVVNTSGTVLNCRRPAINFLSYWDGDLEREILDGYTDSPATISKMTGEAGKTTITNLLVTDGYYTCNTTKGTPCLSADIFGDWREELIVRAADGKSIRIFATTYDTDYRITTLMHDPQYRTQVSSQQTAYNQPPHPSFYLGSDQPLPARPNVVINGSASTKKAGASVDTTEIYQIRNLNSNLYLSAESDTLQNGTNVIQTAKENATKWTLKDAGSGYYYFYADDSHLLDIDYGQTDNGTNIGLWNNTNSDAQLFKLVDNGDGTYLITTAVTEDASGIGVTGGSKDDGANVIEWELDGTANQSWILEPVIVPINGNLVKNLLVYDRAHKNGWSIDSSLAAGDLVFGDREVVFTVVPDALAGAEMIVTACDSKTESGTLAEFTAGKDITVSVVLDQRVVDVQNAFPAWLSDWTKTDLTLANDKDVNFYVYQKDFSAGETVTLGDNGTATSVVNYAVLAQERESQIEPGTTSGQGEMTVYLGDADCNGSVDVLDAVMLARVTAEDTATGITAQGKLNADCNLDGTTNAADLTKLLKFLAGLNQDLAIQVKL